MGFSQKKRNKSTKFVFGSDRLQYSIESKDGSASFTTYYVNIAKEVGTLVERNTWYRNVGWLWIILGAYMMVMRYTGDQKFTLPIWFLLGIIFIAVYHWNILKYSVIRVTDKGRILILHDGTQVKIIDEIYKRRLEQMKHWYSEIDYSNDPEREAHKFKLLLEEEVITTEEYDQALMKLQNPPNMISMN